MLEIEEIIQTYGEKLLRYATSILCHHQDAEDVVQQVFMLAYRDRSMFDGNNLNAWLYKITFNQCMNFKKKRKWFLFGDIRTVREETENPFDEPPESDDFLAALERLKPEDRALLYGRIMDEKSYEELSEIFGKPPASLRKRYERAKKKLAGELNFWEGGRINEYKYEQA